MILKPKRFLFDPYQVWGLDVEEFFNKSMLQRTSGIRNQIIRNRTINTFLQMPWDMATCDNYRVKKEEGLGYLGQAGIGLGMSPHQMQQISPGQQQLLSQGLYNHLSAAQQQQAFNKAVVDKQMALNRRNFVGSWDGWSSPSLENLVVKVPKESTLWQTIKGWFK